CVLIETMNDGYETKAAVIAAKETMEELHKEFPIFVTNVYDADGRTLSGSTPESMVCILEGLGVSAIGVNCSLGPKEMLPTVKRLLDAASVPVIVNPNAGLPKVVNGQTIFDVKPEDFVATMEEIKNLGATILGGCCGTTPEYIQKLTEKIKNQQTKIKICKKNNCVISSNTKTVYFGKEYLPVLIGERINPTGKKKFKEALRNNDIPYIINQGIEQEQAGAQVLDVNVGLPEIDEKEMMLKVVTELQAITELPLQIDTTDEKVMEAAMRRYNGKPLVNSVNGKQEVMDKIFPLVKKYGGVVIGLTLDENGIPETSEGRLKIAQKIYNEAQKYGLSKKDIIIDPLAMAISSDTNAGLATLQTVQEITKMGGNTSLGISNVSFGLPNREFVTSAFFTMNLTLGLTAAIMNPLQQEMMKAYKTFCLLCGKDSNCANYIQWSDSILQGGESLPLATKSSQAQPAAVLSATPSNGENPVTPPTTTANSEPQKGTLEFAVIHGLKDEAAKITDSLLQEKQSLEIINNHLIPGLDYVGKRFEQKTMYLPQLLMAAEAAKSAFTQIRQHMEKSGTKGQSKGKIIIATVKGDIHDIGKNIVKVLLENYDFEVIDLGKDVAPEVIVEKCKSEKIQLVGLSALMTTTVAAMEETIVLLRKECPWAKVCVGGAVMTQEYADQIGADFYGKDAMDTVRYANNLFTK
ncbi:MAG: dihydropteroate synthase, partial [Treponema sp.]|nr:dihydropteroate synthase [Treponema sp.]